MRRPRSLDRRQAYWARQPPVGCDRGRSDKCEAVAAKSGSDARQTASPAHENRRQSAATLVSSASQCHAPSRRHSHQHADPAAQGRRPLRPPLRARCVRRGACRAAGQRPCARGRREGPAGRREPRAPWRHRRRRAHRRRRRDAAADAARVLPCERRLRAARPRPLRRRGLLLAAGPQAPRQARGAAGAQRAHRGPGLPRLARRPRRPRPCRRDRERDAPGHAPGHRRGRPGLFVRPGRLRAQALRHPPHLRARRGTRPLHRVVLLAHDRLQGHARPRPGARLLPRPDRREHEERARARALALLDEHVPELAARASLPRHRPQRRDQHADGQRQLDARARVAAVIQALRPGPAEDHADRRARQLRHGDVRQRARAVDARRPLAAARGDDDDPRGLRRPRRPPRSPQGLLRLSLLPHGAVGRPRRGRLHRRQRRRRDARPQRPAPGALGGDPRRPRDPRLGGRAAADQARGRQAPRPPAAGQAVSRRPRAPPHRRGRGGQARRLHAPALRRVVRAEHRALRRPRRGAHDDDRPAAHAPAPARLRLHAGGRARADRADGGDRRRADRLDGQRQRARRAVGQAPAAVQLLQAALRAGHQPADRPDPRVDRHVAGDRHRRRAQPARRDA